MRILHLIVQEGHRDHLQGAGLNVQTLQKLVRVSACVTAVRGASSWWRPVDGLASG